MTQMPTSRDPAQLLKEADAAHRAGDVRTAERIYRAFLAIHPMHPEVLFRLGSICESTGRLADAVNMYRGSASGSPDNPAPHAALATALERINQLDHARQAVAAALKLDPRHPPALKIGARLARRAGQLEPSKQMLEQALKRTEGAPPRFISSVRLELGQTLDALGRYDEAFEQFQLGKAIWLEMPESRRFKLESMSIVINNMLQFVKPGCTESWNAPGVAPDADPYGLPPVFFVGFPRSGTTLTEQMLGAHPDVVGTDEAPFVSDMIKKAAAMLGATKIEGFFERLSELNTQQIAQLRAGYWQAAEHALRGPLQGAPLASKRLIDKVPLNILSLPMIRRVFPDAPVIVALRDPRDCCLSAFMQQFEPNPAMVHFGALSTTARFYAGVMDCWLAARENLNLRWIESRYESFAAEPEAAARALLTFIGLPWHDRVVPPPSHQTASHSADSGAIAHWKHYERHMAPVMQTLSPYLKALRYPE
ncbi:tetratricopeptide repeat-containing sulfotransferase family protein [Nodularia spumigena]|uniref:tetratricopeptide repeat-containing sulfotransferase family protein n=1 Tax=Nodularia spumigena TaxID=70799 RepID=UPI002B2129AF|nr:sulfotransferase [Nodularia spumigena]MEA5557585.1 sulfotransferase [Nodularia spumigena CH309]